MCNTRTITYTCGHTITFRLSTCRGSYNYRKRKSNTEQALCGAYPQICFYSGWKCGPCEREAAEKGLLGNLEFTRKRLMPTDRSAELAVVEDEYSNQSFLLEKKFPDGRYKKIGRPEKGWSSNSSAVPRKQSLLRREVDPAEVVCGWEANKYAMGSSGWDEDGWGDGWSSLADELAEDDAQRVEEGLPELCPLDAWES